MRRPVPLVDLDRTRPFKSQEDQPPAIKRQISVMQSIANGTRDLLGSKEPRRFGDN